MNKTIGILAHVDSGKTTFTEQILYKNNVIRTLGRVDYKTSYMDCNFIEKERGITIFSDLADFYYNNSRYFLIDTPGHTDFSSEAERAVSVLDYAILIIDGVSKVQAHSVTLFELLKEYNIPVFIFINKIDNPNYD
ncbi:MAG: GTP-binding protein, partial [Lachnospirales bacterium]